jgi:chemotaxis signal transduction protein/CheY-like chemotaxis protein
MRVLLVDDNPEFLKAAERILKAAPRVEVVGRARSGGEALGQIRARQPELVIINWSLPDLNGLEATRRIRELPNPPRVLIQSPHDYPEYLRAAREAGAEGFIPRSEFGKKILSFIEYLTAQDDLGKPHFAKPEVRPAGREPVSPPAETLFGGNPSGESPSGPDDRLPGDRPGSELLGRLGEGLTALRVSCSRIRPLLERGKDAPPGEGDQGLRPVFRGLEKALTAVEEAYREVLAAQDLGLTDPVRRRRDYYLLLEVNQELFGLPADRVLSVEKPWPLIRLPREYEPLVGLSDIEKHRVPVIDLRLWEGMKETPPKETGRLIVVETRKAKAGLLVDTVQGLTASVGSNGFPLPSTPEVKRKPYLNRLIQIKDRFIFVWDVDKILDSLNLEDSP